MSGLSTYLATEYLNWLNGIPPDTAPTAVYVALFDGDPTDAGNGGTEVTEDVRTAGRVEVTFGAIANKAMSNDAEIDFGEAAGAAEVDYFAIFDADTGGNMLASNALETPRSITAGDPVKFAVGDITVDLSSP